MESFPLLSTIHVNPVAQKVEEDGKTDEKMYHKEEEDDAMQPNNTKLTEVVLDEGTIEEEPEQNVPLLVRQLAIIKEPLDAAMAELAASIDGLDTADTPRDGGSGGGGEGGGGGGMVEKTGGRQPGSLSMMPTSDFEEEWRSESEDGEGSDQILQVRCSSILIFTFPRSLSPLKVSSPR